MAAVRIVLATQLAVCACALAAAGAVAADTAFRNPVVPQSAAKEDTPDPWIFRHGGRYWLTYTATGRIEVRTARALGGLGDARPRRLWPPPGAKEPADRCCDVWAPWTIAATPIEISRPLLPWEIVVFPINEGPEVLQRDGLLHVIYSASWCGTGAYALGRLTVPAQADLMDPATWLLAKQPLPVFAAAPGRGIFGPGHGSFFTSPDGRQSWMVYHATDNERGCFTGGVRTTRAQPFRWRADGTPDFGKPVALRSDIAAPGGDATLAFQAEDTMAGPGARVDDRGLYGYRGIRVQPTGAAHRLPPFRVSVARGGRYTILLRVLGGPGAGAVTLTRRAGRPVTRSARRPHDQAVELRLGTVRLRRGANALRLRATAPVTLDQVRLVGTPGRH